MMKQITAAVSAAAIVVMTVGVFAQAKPSFAGKWARQADAAGPAAGAPGGGRGGRGGFGQEVTITQDAATITMEYMGGGQNPAPIKRTFKLDGSPSTNTMMMQGNAMEQVSKATWEADKLVIVTTNPMGGETKQVLSIVGGDLVVDQTAPGRGEGAGPVTTKITYKKAM